MNVCEGEALHHQMFELQLLSLERAYGYLMSINHFSSSQIVVFRKFGCSVKGHRLRKGARLMHAAAASP